MFDTIILMIQKIRRSRRPRLANTEIASICEMWVAGATLAKIAEIHNVGLDTVSSYITKHYLGTTIDKTFTITIQSKLNEQCTEDNY